MSRYLLERHGQPPLDKVNAHDVVFPVTLLNGQLFVLARMTINDIFNADEYTEKTLKIVRAPFLWDGYTAAHQNHITHRILHICANDAAVAQTAQKFACGLC